ncbi:MAG: hypothetical protein JXB47_07165 [Anaerolineae bacterium]|nr:hypothetical protein [Anaerolineae bacterium]
MSERVIPQIKMLVTYDLLPDVQDSYSRFVMAELVPMLRQMGLNIQGAWHTVYGDYPSYLTCFAAESLEALETVLASEIWERLEAKIRDYTTHYSIRVVPFKKNTFQF